MAMVDGNAGVYLRESTDSKALPSQAPSSRLQSDCYTWVFLPFCGLVAQRASASLTRKRSDVRVISSPPFKLSSLHIRGSATGNTDDPTTADRRSDRPKSRSPLAGWQRVRPHLCSDQTDACPLSRGRSTARRKPSRSAHAIASARSEDISPRRYRNFLFYLNWQPRMRQRWPRSAPADRSRPDAVPCR